MGALAQPVYKQLAPRGPCLAGRRASHAGSSPGREALSWLVRGSCDGESGAAHSICTQGGWKHFTARVAAGWYSHHARQWEIWGCHHFHAVYADTLPVSLAGGMLGVCEGTRGVSRAEAVIAEPLPRANTKTPDSALCPQPVTCGQHIAAAQALQRALGCRSLLGQ